MQTAELDQFPQHVVGRVLINRKQLKTKVPLCERTILNMEKEGKFPRRFSVSARLVVWDLNEVEEWIAARKAASIQQRAPGLKPR